jgi:hypothetical protein
VGVWLRRHRRGHCHRRVCTLVNVGHYRIPKNILVRVQWHMQMLSLLLIISF